MYGAIYMGYLGMLKGACLEDECPRNVSSGDVCLRLACPRDVWIGKTCVVGNQVDAVELPGTMLRHWSAENYNFSDLGIKVGAQLTSFHQLSSGFRSFGTIFILLFIYLLFA